MGKNSRLENWLNYRVRVTISDTRYFVGTFFSYDRHMNIVLVDAEEFRKVKDKETGFKEIKRVVGLIMIRGESIVSFTAEQAPVTKRPTPAMMNKGMPTGRGVPINSYIPMQPPFNPNPVTPMGGMPTGMAINTASTKPVASHMNPNFRPPINAPRPPIMPSMGQPPLPNINPMHPRMPPQLPFPPNITPPNIAPPNIVPPNMVPPNIPPPNMVSSNVNPSTMIPPNVNPPSNTKSPSSKSPSTKSPNVE